MSKIPMLEKFAVQSLVEHDGELIFSKEKFAELIVQECMNVLHENELWNRHISHVLKEHFGVEE